MKLLLDQGLPRSTVGHLKKRGILAEHVGELGMARSTDSEIIEAAVSRGAIVATFDSDFHSLLAESQALQPSVIRIRIEGLKGDQAASVLSQVVSAVGEELDVGAAVSVTHTRIRVRKLPLVSN